MAKITKSQIETCYEQGKNILNGKVSKQDCIALISSETEMKDVSAVMYVDAFMRMIKGEYYSRTINAYATEYYLRNIQNDFGIDIFLNAISAVNKHLDYYQGIGKSGQPGIRAIVDRLSNQIGASSNYEQLNNNFYNQVVKSKQDTVSERQIRLKAAKTKPEYLDTSIKIFKRNPDVVAEVLFRAQGICEKCNKPAPFVRARDNTPYLEVHHITRLSQNGDDRVENAIAVCPNCHRELHYGIQKQT